MIKLEGCQINETEGNQLAQLVGFQFKCRNITFMLNAIEVGRKASESQEPGSLGRIVLISCPICGRTHKFL